MKTTKLLIAALASLMLLTTACGKSGNNAAEVPAGNGGGVSPSCTNCTGFVSGPTVFSGNVSGGSYRIDGLTIVSDQNSLASVQTSSPRMTGTYQGLPTGGTFVASGSSSSCVPDGTYSVQGLTVGMISPNLSAQSAGPMWVSLVGPATIRSPIYIVPRDTNGDDIADSGTTIYLWVYCNSAWNSITMTAN